MLVDAVNFWKSWGYGRHDRNYRRSSLKVTNANIRGFVLFKKECALNKYVLIWRDFFCEQNKCSELNFMVIITNPSNICKSSILQDMHVDIWRFLFLYSTWLFKIGRTFKIGWQGNSSSYCCKQQAKLWQLFDEFCCYTQNQNAGVHNLPWSGFRLSLGVSSPTCQFGISNVFPFNYLTAVYNVSILLLQY